MIITHIETFPAFSYLFKYILPVQMRIKVFRFFFNCFKHVNIGSDLPEKRYNSFDHYEI